MENSALEIAYKVLFNEEYDTVLNPNLPENTARMSAEQKKKSNDLRKFAEGTGKILFDKWKNDIQKNLLQLISNPKIEECGCLSCILIREVRSKLHLLIDAEQTINEQKEKEK